MSSLLARNARAAYTLNVIKADKNGNLPNRIEVLKVGMWDTPWHGMFMIKPEDLDEMIQNFNNGVGLPGQGQIGAPIDFGHDSDDEAAGWIKQLSTDGTTLFADVEWTTAGVDALNGGLYKCFSPEFYPGETRAWEDPEEAGEYVPNVLVGGGLTNIPLFKDLKPIMASVTKGDGKTEVDKSNIIYVRASTKEKSMPTLEEVVAKDVAALTEEDKQVLKENEAQLTADQKNKFGIESAPADAATPADKKDEDKVATPEAPTDTVPVDKEAAAVAASIKSGDMVAVKASEFNKLQADVKAMKREKIEASVKTHIARGAIKADQLAGWADRIEKDESMEDLLKNLPDGKVMASEIGSEHAADIDPNISVAERAASAVKASNGTLKIEDAVKQITAEDRAKEKANAVN